METGDLVQVAEDLACQHQGGAHTGRHRTRLPGNKDNRSFSVIVALPVMSPGSQGQGTSRSSLRPGLVLPHAGLSLYSLKLTAVAPGPLRRAGMHLEVSAP